MNHIKNYKPIYNFIISQKPKLDDDTETILNLLFELGNYISACERQLDRMNETNIQNMSIYRMLNISKGEIGNPEILNNLYGIFTDINFLLVAMNKCYKLEELLYEKLKRPNNALKLSKSKYVKDVRFIRNKIEHFDEYMVKQQRSKKYLDRIKVQLNSINYGKYRILTHEIDLFDDPLKNIYTHYNNIIDIIRNTYHITKY